MSLQEDKENTNSLVNKMKAYKDEDPLLKAFDEADKEDGSSSEGSSSGEESEVEESDIKFPRESAEDLLQFINRDLNNIGNKDDGQKRKFSLLKLYEIFVLAKNKAPNRMY